MTMANSEKLRLEAKQRSVDWVESQQLIILETHPPSSYRTARKHLEEAGEHHSPRWFEKAVDPDSNTEFWKYTGGYWEEREDGSWTNLSDIF